MVLEITTTINYLRRRDVHRATIYDGIFDAKNAIAIARYAMEIRRILRESGVVRSIKSAVVDVGPGRGVPRSLNTASVGGGL